VIAEPGLRYLTLISGSVLAVALTSFSGCHEDDSDLVKQIQARSRRSVEATAPTPATYPDQWSGPMTLTVAPGVHVLGRLHPSAVYAIETQQGVILIDSGVDESGVDVRDGLAEVGLSTKKLRYILLTHAHYDHVFGANQLRQVSGAVVAAGRDDCDVLRRGDADALFSLFPRVSYSGTPIKVDQELLDGDEIQLGDVTVQVIGCPGHTPGSVCYLVEKDGQRILFSGDVIASLNFGPATYPVHISPRFRGDAVSYLATINRLLKMEPPDLLLTGHPRQQTRSQTIRMDEQIWNRLLEPAKMELMDAVNRQRQDGADFLDGVLKELEPSLYYLGDLDGIAIYCILDDQHLIVINAPGGNRFADFLSTQLKSLGLLPKTPTFVLLTSDQEACRSGLASLITAPQVVAPPSVWESLRASGVAVVSPQELSDKFTFPITTISLQETLCFSFSIRKKQVLVTSNVPRHISLEWTNRQNNRKTVSDLQPQSNALLTELAASSAVSQSYLESLQQLANFSPNVWLPLMPLTGQNANLYDDDWQTIIESNQRHAKKTVRSR